MRRVSDAVPIALVWFCNTRAGMRIGFLLKANEHAGSKRARSVRDWEGRASTAKPEPEDTSEDGSSVRVVEPRLRAFEGKANKVEMAELRQKILSLLFFDEADELAVIFFGDFRKRN